jgi:hypothetical protein
VAPFPLDRPAVQGLVLGWAEVESLSHSAGPKPRAASENDRNGGRTSAQWRRAHRGGYYRRHWSKAIVSPQGEERFDATAR